MISMSNYVPAQGIAWEQPFEGSVRSVDGENGEDDKEETSALRTTQHKGKRICALRKSAYNDGSIGRVVEPILWDEEEHHRKEGEEKDNLEVRNQSTTTQSPSNRTHSSDELPIGLGNKKVERGKSTP